MEFAEAGAIRPQVVGATLEKISQDQEVADSLSILETQKILETEARVTLLRLRGEELAGSPVTWRARTAQARSHMGVS